MLEGVKKILEENTNRASFFAVVGRHFPRSSEEYRRIEHAYDTAKNAFRDKKRESGERYFEHLRGVALIVMEYLRITDVDAIITALWHDIIEDIDGWTEERVALESNSKVAEFVWWMTKPSVADFGGDKEARNRHYHQNLQRAKRLAIIIKLADRLHNLLTLWSVDLEKQMRKVRETQDFYLPLAIREIVLIRELEQALAEIEASW